MNLRAVVRRAFPYLVIAIAGFAVAYVIVFTFVLPTKLVPSTRLPYVPDSSTIQMPSDTGLQTAPNPVIIAPPVNQTIAPYASPNGPMPVDVPDLTGMALPDARGVLNTLQLQTTVLHDTSSLQPPNTVLRQSPAAGAKVSEHGMVTITASTFPPEPDSTHPHSVPQDATPLPPIQAQPDSGTQ